MSVPAFRRQDAEFCSLRQSRERHKEGTRETIVRACKNKESRESVRERLQRQRRSRHAEGLPPSCLRCSASLIRDSSDCMVLRGKLGRHRQLGFLPRCEIDEFANWRTRWRHVTNMKSVTARFAPMIRNPCMSVCGSARIGITAAELRRRLCRLGVTEGVGARSSGCGCDQSEA